MQIAEKLAGFLEPIGSYRYRAAYGGRGGAKSHTIGRALIVHACTRPLRVLCAREIQVTIKHSAKRLLDNIIDAEGLRTFFRSTEEGIFGLNGTEFIFKGLKSDPDGIKSLEGVDVVWIEEAEPVSQQSLDTLIPTIRKPGSEIWLCWNPKRKDAPVEEMFRGEQGPPPRSLLVEASYRDNPWLSDELREEMETLRARDPVKARHVWDGGYLEISDAQIFKHWTVQEFEAPATARFYYGADWGFSQDPTTLVRFHINGKRLFIDYEAHEVGCEVDDLPALFDKVPDSRKWRIVADSARPELIAHMRKRGFRVQAATKGAGSVEDGISFLQSFDIVVHPRCAHTIKELTDYCFKVDPRTEEIFPTPEDKNNHIIDALRYALERVRKGSNLYK